ncbi:hypothetical protein ACUNXJ_004499, partial [Salmonella enterica subsp. enterica serovar Montevideo]
MLAVSYWRGKRHNHQDSSFSTILVQLLAPASSLTSTETGAKKRPLKKTGRKYHLKTSLIMRWRSSLRMQKQWFFVKMMIKSPP